MNVIVPPKLPKPPASVASSLSVAPTVADEGCGAVLKVTVALFTVTGSVPQPLLAGSLFPSPL